MSETEGPALSTASGIAWERAVAGEAWGQDADGVHHSIIHSGACIECGEAHATDYDIAWMNAEENAKRAALGPYRASGAALTMLADKDIPADVRQLAEKTAKLAAQSLACLVPPIKWFANEGTGSTVYGIAVAAPWSIAIREDLRAFKLVETVAHEVAHSAKPKAEHEDVYTWAASFANRHADLWEKPPVTMGEWRALMDRDRVARAEVASAMR